MITILRPGTSASSDKTGQRQDEIYLTPEPGTRKQQLQLQELQPTSSMTQQPAAARHHPALIHAQRRQQQQQQQQQQAHPPHPRLHLYKYLPLHQPPSRPSPPPPPNPAPPPDVGLRPWKVALGSFCLTVPTFGLLSAIGLFPPFWRQTILLSDTTEGDAAWIIAVFGFLGCLFAAPAGVLFDRVCCYCDKDKGKGRSGVGWLLGLGCAVYVGGFVASAWCAGYAQLMGCMAVAGAAAATPTTIALTVVGQWFDRRKGIATGCVTLGAPLGGIFFSLVLQILFERYTWKTAALVLSAIMAAFLLLGILLVETNPPAPAPVPGVSKGNSDSDAEPLRKEISHMLRSPKFWLICYALFAYELVLFIQWGSIPSYAVAANVSDKQFYLMMSYNIGAILGRTLPPWLSDRLLGPLNATVIMNLFTLLSVLAIWLPLGASSIAALFVVVVLMGIGTGSFVPLGVSCINALCRPENTGTWLGSVYSIVSFATLIGNPVSAIILSRYQSNGLLAFLAAVLFSGMISAVALRWLSHGRRWIFKARV
ncbi:major facilitator superfamily domain-containing protein [Chaetomium sp. MPI-CAGE-AT-0009]|nr:major facilitator superfamily domain-containing protein [Chaetomium sp. MPI-CAGE-AT-0009]